jgi:hypothetical protein
MISIVVAASTQNRWFHDVLLISEGQVMNNGPIGHMAESFESCGFKSPERKGIAGFLQERTISSVTRNFAPTL